MILRTLLLLLALCSAPAYAEGLLDRLGGNTQPSFLPPDQAFSLQVTARDDTTLLANFNVTPGYYLYRDKIQFTLERGGSISQVTLPKGELKQDPNFGEIEVFHQSLQAKLTLQRSDKDSSDVLLIASYQGCSDDGLCYPPIEKKFRLDLPKNTTDKQPPGMSTAPAQTDITPIKPVLTDAPINESGKIAQLFRDGNFWLIVASFFGAGLLLALTPCVFPMIPILSGIIVGRGHNITHGHAFLLSLAYVLGMALTYAAAGVAAGFSGSLISNALQTPWVLGSFAGLFVLLSLSMFGFYELQLPSRLQSKLTDTSNKLHGGHLGGVFLMGALSAIIMGPCVAAPLAGALLYIGQTHDAVLGGTALFALALGMGAPLLLIGSSAGVLLPKAGAWMESVKRFFGVTMLALAIWIVSPIIPVAVQMALWATLLIFSGIYLRALDGLPHNAKARHKLVKGVGIIALLLGVAYLIGALSGATDILKPLGNLTRGEISAQQTTLQFQRVRSLAELDNQLAQAKGKTVMLDFYADWCVSCKEMERFTFSDATVQAKLKNTLLLQADVTANSAEDQALLQRFQLFGPPASLFFDTQGKELTDHRVIGYQDAARFLVSLESAGL